MSNVLFIGQIRFKHSEHSPIRIKQQHVTRTHECLRKSSYFVRLFCLELPRLSFVGSVEAFKYKHKIRQFDAIALLFQSCKHNYKMFGPKRRNLIIRKARQSLFVAVSIITIRLVQTLRQTTFSKVKKSRDQICGEFLPIKG